MPFPNEHAARLIEPEKFEEGSFRRINLAPGMDAIVGRIKGEKSTTRQSIRFLKNRFTAQRAQAWLKEHGLKALEFEPAEKGEPMRMDALGDFEKMELMDNGFIRVPAAVTRTGIFEYRNPDGTIRRELRLPEEVFDSASLDSLKALPVTNEHPRDRLVTAENSKREMVGYSSEQVQRDGDILKTILTITDAKTIDEIRHGKKELSCGYETETEFKPGRHQVFGAYDAVQRKIRYNHIAVTDRARGGSDLIIKLDSADAILITQTAGDNPGGEQKMILKIGDKEYELPETAHAAVTDAFKTKDEKIAELTKAMDAAKATQDAAKVKTDSAEASVATITAENADLKKRLSASGDQLQARLDSQTAELAKIKEEKDALAAQVEKTRTDALITRAKDLLPKDYDTAGKSRLDIMRAAVAKADPGINVAEKTEIYIEARFDSIAADAQRADSEMERLGGSILGRRNDAVKDAEAAAAEAVKKREESITAQKNAWKNPLSK